MLTFQDFQAAPDRAKWIGSAIGSYMRSEAYKIALDADEYEAQRNITILNTVKRGKHISHYALEEAIEICRRVGAGQSFLTHLSHMLPRHADLTKELSALPFSLQPAYDGLTVSF